MYNLYYMCTLENIEINNKLDRDPEPESEAQHLIVELYHVCKTPGVIVQLYLL